MQKNQSPININSSDIVCSKQVLPVLNFKTQTSTFCSKFDGYALEVEIAEQDLGNINLTFGRPVFDLVQFHFHIPAEHAFNNIRSPVEMHMVHYLDSITKHKCVIKVSVVISERNNIPDVTFNSFESILNAAPDNDACNKHISLNISDILPNSHSYYTYDGSLTTKDFTEDVRWILLKEPVYITDEQYKKLAAIMKNMEEGNARDLQDLSGRKVYDSEMDMCPAPEKVSLAGAEVTFVQVDSY